MSLNATAKNLMLTQLGTVAVKVALLNDSSTELSGGSPAYARKDITWGTASAGSMSASNQPAFDIPAGATVSYVRLLSSDGNTQYGDYDVTNEVYAGQGTYTLTSFAINLNK